MKRENLNLAFCKLKDELIGKSCLVNWCKNKFIAKPGNAAFLQTIGGLRESPFCVLGKGKGRQEGKGKTEEKKKLGDRNSYCFWDSV